MDITQTRSARNELAVHAFLDGMARADAELLRSAFADDVVLQLPQPTYTGKTVAGGDHLAEFLAHLSSAVYARRDATLGAMVVDEEKGFAEWRLRATLANGDPYDQYYCWVFAFRDGLITQIREYIDTQYGQETSGRVGGPLVDANISS